MKTDVSAQYESWDQQSKLACQPVTLTALCSDCPPEGYPSDKTRCEQCPRARGVAPTDGGQPGCGEAGHAEGLCGNAQCLPSATHAAWSAPEEALYQRIKARLIEELVVSAPDLRTMGPLQEREGQKNG